MLSIRGSDMSRLSGTILFLMLISSSALAGGSIPPKDGGDSGSFRMDTTTKMTVSGSQLGISAAAGAEKALIPSSNFSFSPIPALEKTGRTLEEAIETNPSLLRAKKAGTALQVIAAADNLGEVFTGTKTINRFEAGGQLTGILVPGASAVATCGADLARAVDACREGRYGEAAEYGMGAVGKTAAATAGALMASPLGLSAMGKAADKGAAIADFSIVAGKAAGKSMVDSFYRDEPSASHDQSGRHSYDAAASEDAASRIARKKSERQQAQSAKNMSIERPPIDPIAEDPYGYCARMFAPYKVNSDGSPEIEELYANATNACGNKIQEVVNKSKK